MRAPISDNQSRAADVLEPRNHRLIVIAAAEGHCSSCRDYRRQPLAPEIFDLPLLIRREHVEEIAGDADEIILSGLRNEPLIPNPIVVQIGKEEDFQSCYFKVDLTVQWRARETGFGRLRRRSTKYDSLAAVRM